MKKWYTLTTFCSIILVVALVMLVLVSWIISSAFPVMSVRSLLSGEGVRWFFGSFVAHAASAPLVWLVLLSVAVGAYRSSGLSEALGSLRPGGSHLLFRQRFALFVVIAELVLLAVILALLTLVPHAILLSSTGTLLGSPFSRSVVPMLAFTVVLCSLSYGLASRTLSSAADVMRALTAGFQPLLPLFILYLLVVQLLSSAHFVFFS